MTKIYKGYIKNLNDKPIRIIAQIEEDRIFIMSPYSMGWQAYYSKDLHLFPKPIKESHIVWSPEGWWTWLWKDGSWNWIHSIKTYKGLCNNIYWKFGGGNKWKKRLENMRRKPLSTEDFQKIGLENYDNFKEELF